MNNLVSPLIPHSEDISLIEELDVSLIKKEYKKNNIDVSEILNQSSIKLYRCNKSGYRFYYPFKYIGGADFYKELSKNRENYYSQRWEHHKALDYIGEGAEVLEIGAGFGVFLEMLKSKGNRALGLELNPHAVENCKKKQLKVEEKLIQEVEKEYKNRFDVVCYFQVLEHICEVHDFIESSVRVLKKGGKLIIGVPNSNPYLFKKDKYHALNLPPHHAGLWNKESLISLEKIFPLKWNEIKYEPLDLTYAYYLSVQIRESKSIVRKKVLKGLNRFFPKLLRKIICYFNKGRNVLVVYSKA